MAKLDLQVTAADVDSLWKAANKARDDLSVIKLSKGQLVRLLLDHGRLLEYYEKGR